MKRVLRGWRVILSACGLVVVATLAAGGAWIYSLGPAPLGEGLTFSTLVVDHDGRLLRPFATADGRWRLPVTAHEVDPRFVKMLIAYEDKRFYSHRGVDPWAMLRAAEQLLTHGRIVSGGSTLTMQVARLLEPRAERTFLAKLRQIVRAIEIERKLNKQQILTLYLNLAPYGGNIEGIRAAALSYFGREPRRLSLEESALLVALPQSPEQRRPDRAAKAARAARDRVLDRVVATLKLPADEVAAAKRLRVPHERQAMPMLAPHAAEQAVAAEPSRKLIRLTIDAHLQRRLENLARERVRKFGPDASVAIVAVDQETGNVLARVASADYFDDRRDGRVDMTQAVRSPGSTLKPFIYGIGFEDGIIHPDTLVDDRPVRYGAYAPENFDLSFQGTVTVRKALQLSLNVPAVNVLEAVRASRLTARLTQAGAALTLPKGEVPGLAMGLGGVGVTLSDLTMLYAGLARLGWTVPLTERIDETKPLPTPRRLIDRVAAWYVGNILIGAPPPDNAPPGRIAFKTGTSYGYRDAWAIGFDGKTTIGVWVGRPDGTPIPGLVGRAAAAPILFDAFARLDRSAVRLPGAPKGAILASTARLPMPLRQFRPGGLPSDSADPPIKIMFPPDGVRLELAKTGGVIAPMPLKIVGGVKPITVLVNGVPLTGTARDSTLLWEPDGPGFVRLTVMDKKGATDSVVVRVQ